MDSCLKIVERGLFCPWCCFLWTQPSNWIFARRRNISPTQHNINCHFVKYCFHRVFVLRWRNEPFHQPWVGFSYIAGSWSATFLHQRTNARRKWCLTNWLLILCHVDEIMGRHVTNYKFRFLCSHWKTVCLKAELTKWHSTKWQVDTMAPHHFCNRPE